MRAAGAMATLLSAFRAGDQLQGVSDCRDGYEQQESSPSTVEVGDPPAGVLIKSIQQVARSAVQPDRKHGCAECLEVLRHEALPELFAGAEEEHCTAHGDDVSFEASGTR